MKTSLLSTLFTVSRCADPPCSFRFLLASMAHVQAPVLFPICPRPSLPLLTTTEFGVFSCSTESFPFSMYSLFSDVRSLLCLGLSHASSLGPVLFWPLSLSSGLLSGSLSLSLVPTLSTVPFCCVFLPCVLSQVPLFLRWSFLLIVLGTLPLSSRDLSWPSTVSYFTLFGSVFIKFSFSGLHSSLPQRSNFKETVHRGR